MMAAIFQRGRILSASAPGRGISHIARKHAAVLGLSANRVTSPQDVKAAYRQAVLRTHPDRHSGSTESFRKVQVAYEYLLNKGGTGRSSDARAREPPDFDWFARLRTQHSVKMRTSPHAERLFREAYGGRSIDEVLKAEMGGQGAAHGVHTEAVRQALFVRLLSQARERVREKQAADAAGAQEEHAHRGQPDGAASAGEARPRALRTVRTRFTAADGTRHVRVVTLWRLPGGQQSETVSVKPIFRM